MEGGRRDREGGMESGREIREIGREGDREDATRDERRVGKGGKEKGAR